MVQTVIGINSAMMRTPDKKRPKMDYKKELQEIIGQVESVKNRLAQVTEAMDFYDNEVDSLDEALDALDDAKLMVPGTVTWMVPRKNGRYS